MSGGAAVLAAGVGLFDGPISVAATLARTGPPFDVSIHVHPELREVALAILKRYEKQPPTIESLLQRRKESLGQPPLPDPTVVEKMIAARDGERDVRLYVINASSKGSPRPAVLHMHGGGFVLGDAKGSLRNLQRHAKSLDCVIVTVDYRLAPQTRFPGALEDNYAALKWLYDNADELGVDPSRIAVMGESAGGGHAAMLAIAARDRGEVPLVFQALLAPMLDDRTGSTRDVPAHIGTLQWTRELNRIGWTSLLGVPAGSHDVPIGAVPARVENLQGLPPTFITVGSIDLFVLESMEYARRLVEAGVSTALNVVPGAFHGFSLLVPGATIAKNAELALSAALADALRPQTMATIR